MWALYEIMRYLRYWSVINTATISVFRKHYRAAPAKRLVVLSTGTLLASTCTISSKNTSVYSFVSDPAAYTCLQLYGQG